MHSLTKIYLFLTLSPLALANMVSQISDGQIQEPAEAPAVVAPKVVIAPAGTPAAAPAPPTSTSTSIFTAVTTASASPPPAMNEAGASIAPRPAISSPNALNEAGASVAFPPANTTIPAPAKIEEAATTAPILIAPPANITSVSPHHANYEAPMPSASVGKVVPVENGTAPTVPVMPALPTFVSQAPTSVEGSPREAGTTQAVSKGGASKLGAGVGLTAVGMGLIAVVVG